MRIAYEPYSWKKPANKLIACVQGFCKEILKDPVQNGIEDLYCLEERVWEHLHMVQSDHPRCKPADIKTEVTAFNDHQSFKLEHRNDNMLPSVHVSMFFDDPAYPSYAEPLSGRYGRIVIDFDLTKNDIP